MLRKIFLISAVLIFAFGILLTSVWRTVMFSQPANKDYQVLAASITIEVSEKAREERQPVDYFLAYPGVLPDHFLYPIKMLRDRVLLFLTTDSLKKAKLFLLFADKRISTAKSLMEKNETELAITTASKAEKYLEKAINQEKIARDDNKGTTVFLETLNKAALKHEEVLLEMAAKVEDLILS